VTLADVSPNGNKKLSVRAFPGW